MNFNFLDSLSNFCTFSNFLKIKCKDLNPIAQIPIIIDIGHLTQGLKRFHIQTALNHNRGGTNNNLIRKLKGGTRESNLNGPDLGCFSQLNIQGVLEECRRVIHGQEYDFSLVPLLVNCPVDGGRGGGLVHVGD